MVPIASLWLPILLSAVIVFVASSIIHTVLGYHRSDYGKVPSEDEVRSALRKIPAGEYVVPHAASPKEMSSPEYVAKTKEGPNVLLTVAPAAPSMPKLLVLWFLYCVVVGILVAYITGRALPPGADYLEVFRFAGGTAFIAYAVGLWQDSIWYGRRWSTTLKSTFDALVYALLTAGTFGWLWPAA